MATVLAVCVGVAWASTGDWNAAKSKAEDFKKRAEEVKRQTPLETRKIVTAICAAEDESRKSAGESASRDARSNINDKFSELERTKRDAIDLLEHVIDDDKLKDHKDEARSLESDVKSRWEKLDELTKSLRDERHPVVEYMLKHGESAVRDHADHCDVKDFRISFDQVACLEARGETCKIVEFAADNSRAISKGKDRAYHAKSALESELKKDKSDVMKQLIDKKSDFAKCKHFESQVDCYKLCPEIDDDNRSREPSPNWRTDC